MPHPPESASNLKSVHVYQSTFKNILNHGKSSTSRIHFFSLCVKMKFYVLKKMTIFNYLTNYLEHLFTTWAISQLVQVPIYHWVINRINYSLDVEFPHSAKSVHPGGLIIIKTHVALEIILGTTICPWATRLCLQHNSLATCENLLVKMANIH